MRIYYYTTAAAGAGDEVEEDEDDVEVKQRTPVLMCSRFAEYTHGQNHIRLTVRGECVHMYMS